MEMRIGETFEFKAKSYVAREGEGCKGCAFLNEDCNCNARRYTDFIGKCSPSERTDHKSVIFVEVDEEGKDKSSSIEEDSRKETKSILEEAIEILNGSRQCDYGDPAESFKRIAQLANLMSNSNDFTPVKCCIVMIASKLTRESHKHKRDNLVDLCGYGAIMNRIIESQTKER